MILQKTRTLRQEEGAIKAKQDLADCGKACLNYFTGFGKTHVSFTYFIKPMLEKYPDYSVMILTPTTKLKNQWLEKVEKKYKNRIKIECWHSVYNSEEVLNYEL